MCDSCLAQNTTKCDESMHFKNVGPSAAWPLTLVDHSKYLAMPGQLSPWRTVPGWTLESCVFDFMHNCYLGTARDLIGSGLRCLIYRGIYDHLGFHQLDDILAHIQVEMIDDCSKAGFLGVILEVLKKRGNI